LQQAQAYELDDYCLQLGIWMASACSSMTSTAATLAAVFTRLLL